jgi:hypothetical protein
MLGLKIYRILTFILLPIEALFGLMALMMLVVSLGNFAALLPVFMLSCTVIYVFASFRFLNSGIQQAKPINPSLKHWIRVNGLVSLVFCMLSLFQFATLLLQPEIMQQFYKQAISTQQQIQGLTPQYFEKMLKGLLYFMLAYAILLLVHIYFTFRFLQQYQHVFDDE